MAIEFSFFALPFLPRWTQKKSINSLLLMAFFEPTWIKIPVPKTPKIQTP